VNSRSRRKCFLANPETARAWPIVRSQHLISRARYLFDFQMSMGKTRAAELQGLNISGVLLVQSSPQSNLPCPFLWLTMPLGVVGDWFNVRFCAEIGKEKTMEGPMLVDYKGTMDLSRARQTRGVYLLDAISQVTSAIRFCACWNERLGRRRQWRARCWWIAKERWTFRADKHVGYIFWTPYLK